MQRIFGGSRNKNARSENLVLFYSRSLGKLMSLFLQELST
jgi:hypothetical protein